MKIMTFQQKNTLITLVNFLCIFIFFGGKILEMVYTSTFEFDAVIHLWLVVCVWAVAGTILGVVVTQVFSRINKRNLSNEEFEAMNIVDERDSEIDHKGTFITYKITSIGSVIAMITFASGCPALIMFVTFVGSGLAGQIVGDIYRMRLYSGN